MPTGLAIARGWRRTVARLVAAVALAGTAACPASRQPAGHVAPAVEAAVIEVEPLSFAVEAARPDRAILVGAASGPRGAQRIPLAGAPRTIAIDGVSITAGPGAGALAIDVPGIEAAAARRAAAAVAALLGKAPTAIDCAATVGTNAGATDAASAALIATGLAAALLGRTIDPAVTIVGEVASDDSIAPIEGLAARVEAAIARGRRRIGVPRGTAAGLAAVASAGGATLVELGDLYDALVFATGGAPPRPIAVAAAVMVPAPSANAEDALRPWRLELTRLLPRVIALSTSRAVPPPIVAAAERTQRSVAASERARLDHRDDLARTFLIRAWTDAAIAVATADLLVHVRAGQPTDARARLAPRTRGLDVSLAMSDLAVWPPAPPSPSPVPVLVAAVARHGDQLDAIEARLRADAVALPALDTLLASLLAESPAALAQPAVSARVVDAALPLYTETTAMIIAGQRAAEPLPTSAAPPLAYDAARVQRFLAWHGADTSGPPLVALARAWRTRLAAARAVELPDEVLAAQLALAATRAREHARVAEVATGAIPDEARCAHARAASLATGDRAAREDALAAYRASSAWSQLAISLSLL